ncbi:transglycosylase domain-containing protein [Seonamhaeicola maritimus]|uniref:Glycosyl transferase family 51 domain-containing protein n=1 Tax=Seonamhaeicola maritimus TaxID=2591822 RepID=A0A5C7GHW4_9FLAO|nr:transglycosylase domain-containing protein [Seonamhaeicola maritimus]TXG37137.1 hypothetical protein FUA22_11265 [Seonamhaeicola maritimus]
MRLVKRLLKFVIWVIVFGGFATFVGYHYLKSTSEDFISADEFEELAGRIEFADNLPERFYELYEEAYPKVLSTSLNKQLVKGFFAKNYVKSPSILASTISKFSRKDGDSTSISRKKAYVLAWKLEDRRTQKECLNWALHNYQFTIDFKGINQVAQFYFAKPLENLTDQEFKDIIALMKKPSLVSLPKRGPLGTH